MDGLHDVRRGIVQQTNGRTTGLTLFEEKTLAREAPGKINLYLRVTGRRADGYHELDSLVVFTRLHDLVTLRPATELSLAIDGPFTGPLLVAPENLVMAAAQRLQTATGERRGAHINLTKNLPVAAGLGGGSADAAATLLGLCDLWRIDRHEIDLAAIGVELGADVPVCLYGQPALVAGVGEQIRVAPRMPEAGLLLVNPRQELATPAVFDAREGPFSSPLPMIEPVADVAGLARDLALRGNDLTTAAVALCPPIAAVLTALRSLAGCRGCGMSGSGATCYGLFDDEEAAKRAVDSVSQSGWWAAATSLRSPRLEGEAAHTSIEGGELPVVDGK